MRILQALAGAHHGGAELFFERLVPALSATGIEQRVLIRKNQRRAEVLAGAGVTDVHQVTFGNRLDLATRVAFRKQVRDFAPDIVFTWMNRASIIAPKSPLGSTRFTRVARLGGYYNLKYYRGCDYLIGDTDAIVDYLIDKGWPADKAVHLPNFVVEKQGTPLSRADFFLPEGAPLILALGRLHEHKGFDVLLHSLVRVPDAYLLLAGVGPLETELEALAVKLGVRPRVRLLGWRDDVSDLLATVDLFVHPARHEPLGNVILEAWAQNCPVVSTAAEGPKVLIESGVSGLLTPVDDADALADAIRALVADPERRQVLAAGGRTTYDRKFKSIGRGFSLPQFLRADHRLMCGIAGIMTTSGAAPDPNLLAALSRALAHRGPDGTGFYQSGDVGFTHVRLAIIDLETGDQPLKTDDGLVLVPTANL